MTKFIDDILAQLAGLLIRRAMIFLAGISASVGLGEVFAGQATALETALYTLVTAGLWELSRYAAKVAAARGLKLS